MDELLDIYFLHRQGTKKKTRNKKWTPDDRARIGVFEDQNGLREMKCLSEVEPLTAKDINFIKRYHIVTGDKLEEKKLVTMDNSESTSTSDQ